MPLNFPNDADLVAHVDAMLRAEPNKAVAQIALELTQQKEGTGLGPEARQQVMIEMEMRHVENVRYWSELTETDDWHDRAGPWQEIGTVPHSDPVDLFVNLGELIGEVVTGCWWKADAVIPDWYHQTRDGREELAAPIGATISHWKPEGAEGAPVRDGGPGLLVRINFDFSDFETWPEESLARYRAYEAAIEAGQIDEKVVSREQRMIANDQFPATVAA